MAPFRNQPDDISLFSEIKLLDHTGTGFGLSSIRSKVAERAC